MSKKLSEQKVLEGLIRAHLDDLEFKISGGISKAAPSIISESIQVTSYINRYRKLPAHPKLGVYLKKAHDLLYV